MQSGRLPVIEATVYLTASAGLEILKRLKFRTAQSFRIPKEFKELLKNLAEKPSAWIDSNGALFNVDTKALQLRYPDFPVLPLRKGWLHGHIR